MSTEQLERALMVLQRVEEARGSNPPLRLPGGLPHSHSSPLETVLNPEGRGDGHPSAPGSTFAASNSLIKSQKLGILES